MNTTPNPEGRSSSRGKERSAGSLATNPVALITGGSRGIGRATALRLAQDGFDVALCYASDASAAQEVERSLRDLGRNVYVRRTDVADAGQVRTLVAGVEDALGPVTALVASAAIVRDTPLVLMEDEDWDAVMRVNLDGVYHVCRSVVDEMVKRRHGAIVTVSSLAGVRGNVGQSNYAATKAGIIGFTTSVAYEVGRFGVRANVVVPGFINTDQLTRLPDALLERVMERTALRRLGNADEVANLVSFLLSDQAEYVTGGVFPIDGGFQ